MNRFWPRILLGSPRLLSVVASIAIFMVADASAQTLAVPVSTAARPRLLLDVGIDQKLGGQIPLQLTFRDETGATVRLGNFFGEKPVILALVYYECPMLCTQVLNGVVRSLKEVRFEAGQDFQFVVVSINPLETPRLAQTKQQLYAGLYIRPGAEHGFHFLTGEDSSIAPLAQAAGFRYAYDPETRQYAHASAIIVLTPEGKISRYFYGIQYPARDLRLGLVEASAGKIGSPVDQILLFCYHYDPATGKYGLVILNIVRAACLGTLVGLAAFITVMFRRERMV
jgi:protein SCO1/2